MSNTEKPTLDLDQLAIIRGLLERNEAKMDAVSAEVRTVSAEQRASSAELRSLGTTTEGIRTEVQRLNTRMTEAEGDIRELREKDATIATTASNADLAHEAAIGGAIVHVRTLEASVKNTEKVQAAICHELGLDHEAIVDEGRSLPPGVKAPKTTLTKIVRENRLGTVAAVAGAGFTFLIIVAKIVAAVLGVHLD